MTRGEAGGCVGPGRFAPPQPGIPPESGFSSIFGSQRQDILTPKSTPPNVGSPKPPPLQGVGGPDPLPPPQVSNNSLPDDPLPRPRRRSTRRPPPSSTPCARRRPRTSSPPPSPWGRPSTRRRAVHVLARPLLLMGGGAGYPHSPPGATHTFIYPVRHPPGELSKVGARVWAV